MQVYYFTRTGRSKKVAAELAERYDIKAQEIADDVDWQGPVGYLKAGYEAFKKETRPARYNKPTADEELILVFPVWAGTFPPAVRTFLEREGRAKVICMPTSIGSKLNDREGFIKVIDLVGKTITTPDAI
ncbi:MAG: flavodoxin [Acidaminococcaceae bacterium]